MMKKLSAAILVAMAATPAFAEESDIGSQSKSQAIGYIGELSKQAIQAGNLWRLQAVGYDDAYSSIDNLSERVKFWHTVALDTVALDHTPAAEGEGSPLNQGGPTRTSRALAMVQIAVFDALNAIEGDYVSYGKAIDVDAGASPHAAVAFAAFRTLKRLYPAQEARLKEIRDNEVDLIKSFTSRSSYKAGKDVGVDAFKAIREDRRGDKSGRAEPDFGEGGRVANGGKETFFGTKVNGGTRNIGEWQPDPNTPATAGDFNLALGAFWGNVKPFTMDSGDQFRIAPPPLPDSEEYAKAYAEVAAVGGAPTNERTTSTSTDATRFVGNYWGYDGVPLIGVPPRIYNQIAIQIAKAEGQTDALDLARTLAMVNVGMADVGIAAWDSKFYYNYWRPVTGIRSEDLNEDTVKDITWDPVGVSVINTTESIRPTPPFPAYPSGHAAFGGVTFEVLRDAFGDDTPFTFVSDEYNGLGVDPFFPDVYRPFVPVRFESLTDAQEQNGVSRVYNGVHWNFDDIAGQQQGTAIGHHLINNVEAFQPAW
ncbi:vanadium-dependent haloperoxidase [Sessilibacter corallicola]|uniref:vanadium-dependent haloperoxidase n=1 Tax=Sessilibacter corallicola TaxID=2904075 RepID=UPI001E501D69|nr:vanadium-dependent haloperoxidase [Sessilibacter corallicola]MCE2027285.1 hypothetical protein [Sessilibacter corallicola]